MTVAKLIKQLETYPRNYTIVCTDEDGSYVAEEAFVNHQWKAVFIGEQSDN